MTESLFRETIRKWSGDKMRIDTETINCANKVCICTGLITLAIAVVQCSVIDWSVFVICKVHIWFCIGDILWLSYNVSLKGKGPGSVPLSHNMVWTSPFNILIMQTSASPGALCLWQSKDPILVEHTQGVGEWMLYYSLSNISGWQFCMSRSSMVGLCVVVS